MAHPLHTEFSGIAALRDALLRRQVSAVEVAQSALDAINTQGELNAFLDVNPELTLAQAQAADALLAQGEAAPALTGVPIAHKDVFVTQGWRTTAASKMLENYVSPFDAAVVERLQAAGAVSLGKLNCDEFAMGSSNESSAFGAVRNPWDDRAIPGGSSGGSAAAVAAGLIMGATATDTGGSIRQPAAFCGVSGIKPTYGTVSRYGMIAYASSFDQAGPIARSARDLLALLDPIQGFDERDATSLERCRDQDNAPGRIHADFQRWSQSGSTDQPLAGLRIGIPTEFFGAGLSPEVAQATETALRKLEELGAVRVPVSLPRTQYCIPAYYVLTPAEASSNLSRFDGVRYGHRSADYQDLNEMISRSRAEAFGTEVQRRILVGTYVLSHGYYDAYYVQAQKLRRMIAEDFQKALSQCDLIIGPVTPSVAWNLGEKSTDPVAMYLGDIYTLSLNLAGLPGMSIPCGFGQGDNSQRPIGLQLIGNYFDEGRLLAVADTFQQATDWHQRRPGAK